MAGTLGEKAEKAAWDALCQVTSDLVWLEEVTPSVAAAVAAAVRADIGAEAWDEGARAGLDAGLGAGEWAMGSRPWPSCAPTNPYRCHCGEPVRFGFDGNPEHHRGMCAHCDAVRCDAYPGECRDRSEVQA